ncbi:MAG: sensor hybrid histidine kinase [Verrucomicrobia bacterium]|nr:sensor hybrid histidine kinase [Verrucomicrobiota bacterium]
MPPPLPTILSDPEPGMARLAAPETWLGAWETSTDPAHCRDLDGRLLAVNSAFARKFGRSPEALVGTSVTELVHADDAASLLASTAELNRPPHRTVSEHRWLTPQGIRWFAWEEAALKDSTGAIIAFRAAGRDITRQRLAEEQFHRLSSAVEQSPVAIVITDLDGRAQYVNPKFTDVSGRTLEDLLDRHIEVLRDGHPDEASYEKFWQTVRSGGEWRGELATRRQDGGTVWESVKVSCLRNPAGETTNYLCLREDVSERKKLEHDLRQAHKMESLGTLAGGIAHDFNNLLAIINGYAEFCLHGTADTAILQKSLREIRTAAQRAGGLVRQILTFTRKTEVKFTAVDLNQLVRDLVKLLAETFPRTVTFNLELPALLPPLLADQNQLQQIILNLCVNARDAMPTGGTITLDTSVHDGGIAGPNSVAGRSYACLRITDTGTGMAPEVRARIFEPFFTTKQGNQGTGLGLAVVYGIVESHQGAIEVDSIQGVGSTFSIFLPLAVRQVLAPAAAVNHDFPSGTESLLIVDDEDSLRELLVQTFRRQGYKATTAASGNEAIDVISDTSRHFDLVLLDSNMPGATGLQVMKVIRLCRPRTRVLVLSGHITPETRADFQHLGQRDFMQKPYTLDEMGRRIRQMLDNSQG